jgi:hypothetical protein
MGRYAMCQVPVPETTADWTKTVRELLAYGSM